MCVGKGMIVRRYQQEPDWDKKTNDHEPLVTKLGLKDNRLLNRNWVRIELWPCGDLFSQAVNDWEVKVDDRKTGDLEGILIIGTQTGATHAWRPQPQTR